jgi:hypothetical protein
MIQSLVAIYKYTPARNTQLTVKILNEIHIYAYIYTDGHLYVV